MGRIRRDQTTKVWHNPDISGRRGGHDAAPRVAPTLEERRTVNAHRAALEALFSPKKDDDSSKVSKAVESALGKPGRIVLAPPPQADPKAGERQRLLGKLLAASGRPAITKAANEIAKQGFTLPQEQDVYLQLLEHTSEERVQEALTALATILLGELPKRRAVLESRLRRIEEFAEDAATRNSAAELRRQVAGRSVSPSAKGLAPVPSASVVTGDEPSVDAAAPSDAVSIEEAAASSAPPETTTDSSETDDAPGDTDPAQAEVA